MPDIRDLSAEELLQTYADLERQNALCQHRTGDPLPFPEVLPVRAELLRRLRQWDALAMGPVDPPAEG
jgi:hypothetical protein